MFFLRALKNLFQKFILLIIPAVRVNSKYNYKILGEEDHHYYVGYYDKDPVNTKTKKILCHKVSKDYSNLSEPPYAKIGLMTIEDNSFEELTSTRAVNWQLASRAQWLDENTIIYNDIDKDTQCSIKFDVVAKEKIIQYKRPFWDISHDKKYGASLNFSRIKLHRPGYGYAGKNIDDMKEILNIFSLENDSLIYSISLTGILEMVNFKDKINDNIYLNHIVWSPCGKKLITIFHFIDKITKKRVVNPVLIDLKTKKIDLLHNNGNFSHHTFVDENRILAYLKINDDYCFGVWSKDIGWKKIKKSMPTQDGHPTYIKTIDKVVVDNYPNRLGIMSLYLGSLNQNEKLEKIASIINDPQYKGAIRCDLHPRVSLKNDIITCDLPQKNTRKILIIEGVRN